MPAQPTEWTIEMVRALPDDGNRYEVVGGELFVTPAPTWTHQRAVSELLVLLVPYLRQHRLGDAIVEVLSPSTRRTDRTDKLDLYRRKGIPEYWIVDTDDRTSSVGVQTTLSPAC